MQIKNCFRNNWLVSVTVLGILLPITQTSAMADTAPQTIQIAAAANLTNVFTKKIIPAFLKKTGITVLPTFGATGLLARQLEAGAPYEVFVSADATTPVKLAGEHDLDPATVKPYAVGKLVLWSKLLSVDQDGLKDLTATYVHQIAIANPKTAPYGAASIQTLTSLNLLTTIQPKIVYADNISQAFQYAQTGNVDMAFTALALTIGQDGYVFVVPEKYHAPLVQSIGLIPNASAGAVEFEQFLLSKDGQKILAEYGYAKPPK